MFEFLEILIVAVAQGIGEFLPISSSGHNAVVNALFERFGVPLARNNSEFLKLNILLHVGSLAAVLIVFRQRIMEMLADERRILIVCAATVPAVAVGLPIHQWAPWMENCLPLISGCFIVTGILLLLTLKTPEGGKTVLTMTWKDAMIIGCAQAVAILPGVSRSGTTIVAGLFCKLKREEAAAFSFILSIPVIAGSGVLEIRSMFKTASAEKGTISDGLLMIGMLVSCVVGIAALVWLLDWLKKGKLWYFALWVFVMSPFTLMLALTSPPDNADGKNADIMRGVPQTPANSAPDETPKSPLDAKPELQDTDDAAAMEAERERILAEEKTKEETMIAEEHAAVPLVENPDKLIPLNPQHRIWVDIEQKRVVMIGRVVLREGLLELLACRVRTKEHESLLSVRVEPHLIHTALLVVNARQGEPMKVSKDGEFTPATGDKISITLHWQENGEKKSCPAQDWVWDAANSGEDAKKPMSSYWVFSGSREYQDEEGQTHYVADESGELFGLSNFIGSILDIPIQSSSENAKLQFACFTERIPPLDTLVTIVLTPVP